MVGRGARLRFEECARAWGGDAMPVTPEGFYWKEDGGAESETADELRHIATYPGVCNCSSGKKGHSELCNVERLKLAAMAVEFWKDAAYKQLRASQPVALSKEQREA